MISSCPKLLKFQRIPFIMVSLKWILDWFSRNLSKILENVSVNYFLNIGYIFIFIYLFIYLFINCFFEKVDKNHLRLKGNLVLLPEIYYVYTDIWNKDISTWYPPARKVSKTKQEKSFNILKEHSYLNGLSIYYRNAE